MTAVAPAPQGATTSLVETKLARPRVRAQIVDRPRLLRALDRLDGTELTLVSAPPGSGKTLLAASWCAARPDRPVAWVTLDAADNDPVRLWTYVATAVDRLRPGVGVRALERLDSRGAGPMPALDELLSAISRDRKPLAIVLDDLHVLRDATALRSIEYAVDQLPRNARLIVMTRADPLIRLGRLRARKALGEIRVRDLAFTPDETRELMVAHERIGLDDEDLALLHLRSEGWAAGLYLAALWLRDQPDPKAGIRDFSGDHRHLAEYLSSEVIDGLDEETRGFLLHTSVLSRLSGPLCDAVLDTAGSDTRLAMLARSNLFLVPLDPRGEWYRYHHLFGELLRMELRRTEPTAPARLHRRACSWCRQHELIDEALEHADASGDDAVVAEILLEQHRELLRTGREATLLRWVQRIGTPALLDAPELCAAGAIASGLLSRSASERASLLGVADRAVRERPERLTPYVAATLGLARGAWIDGDTQHAIESARSAAELGRRGADEIAVPALAGLGFALYMGEDLAGSREAVQEALDRPEALARPHGLVYAEATMALLELAAQRAHIAESWAERALEHADAAGLAGSWSAGLAYSAHGAALVALGHLARGERQAERGEALRRGPEPTVEHVHALLIRAEARIARNRLGAAGADLERATEALEGFADPGRLAGFATRLGERLSDAQRTAPPLVEEPSPSELAVLRLLATDLTQRQIGRQLFLSLNTVKTHARGIYRKLGASSREEAVARAEALGLFDEDDEPTG
jgi:LuxR family maltose regulon positive regulatory protein